MHLAVVFVTILAALSTASPASSATALPAPARAIPIFEDTEPPANPPDNYSPCKSPILTPFYVAISTESTDCMYELGYVWHMLLTTKPTDEKRREICRCMLLLHKLQRVAVPHCLVSVDGVMCRYAKVVAYYLGLCNLDTAHPTSDIVEWPAECQATTAPLLNRTAVVVTTSVPNPQRVTVAPIITVVPPEPEPSPSHRTATLVGVGVGGVAVCTLTLTLALRFRVDCRSRKRSHTKPTRQHEHADAAVDAPAIASGRSSHSSSHHSSAAPSTPLADYTAVEVDATT